MADPDPHREAKIAAIARSGRESRPKSSRTLWIAGLAMGAICIAAFVAFMLADGDAPSHAPLRLRDGSRGFATGLAIGVGVGIAIGYAIARQRKSS